MESLLLQRGSFEHLPEYAALDLADPKTDGFHIDIPGLSSKEKNHQIDALILAWALLLSRGSLEQSPEELNWGFAAFAGDACVQKVSASVSDVGISDADQISEKLETVRRIRGQSADGKEFVLAAACKADVSHYTLVNITAKLYRSPGRSVYPSKSWTLDSPFASPPSPLASPASTHSTTSSPTQTSSAPSSPTPPKPPPKQPVSGLANSPSFGHGIGLSRRRWTHASTSTSRPRRARTQSDQQSCLGTER